MIIKILLVLIILIYLRSFFPLIITYKRIHPLAKKPEKSYNKASCWDIFSVEDVTIPSNSWKEINTGIVFIPWPYIYIPFLGITFMPLGNVAAKIYTIPGLALKKGVRINIGMINYNTRNTISVIMYNHNQVYPVRFRAGDKIAQIEFYRVPSVLIFERKKLPIHYKGIKELKNTNIINK